jgi:hypothetical protein
VKRPTNLNRLNLWQSRKVQDAAIYLCVVIVAVVMSIPW